MVKIEKQYIEKINWESLKGYPGAEFDNEEYDWHSAIHIERSIIGRFDLAAIHMHSEVIIKQCIIETLYLDYCYFCQGFNFSDNLVINDVSYQAGVHNQRPFVMTGNVFSGFLDFFDCQFENTVIFTDNILLRGSNLLGNKGKGWENSFNLEPIIEKNIGVLNISE